VRAQFLAPREETRQAEADLRKAISLLPSFPRAYGNLGWLPIKQGRFEEALPVAQKVHELDPNFRAWALNLGPCPSAHRRPLDRVGILREVATPDPGRGGPDLRPPGRFRPVHHQRLAARRLPGRCRLVSPAIRRAAVGGERFPEGWDSPHPIDLPRFLYRLSRPWLEWECT
jgi:tetratricopeptide (TPR) repeat protein